MPSVVREDGRWHRWPGRVLAKQHSSPYRLETRHVGLLGWLLRTPLLKGRKA
jgi:hypothetical protein